MSSDRILTLFDFTPRLLQLTDRCHCAVVTPYTASALLVNTVLLRHSVPEAT